MATLKQLRDAINGLADYEYIEMSNVPNVFVQKSPKGRELKAIPLVKFGNNPKGNLYLGSEHKINTLCETFNCSKELKAKFLKLLDQCKKL